MKGLLKDGASFRLVGNFFPIKEKTERILCVFASILTPSGGKLHAKMNDVPSFNRPLKLLRAFSVLAIILLLTSCAKAEQDAQELVLEIRTDYIKAEKLTIGADITADYGDRVYDFAIKYAGDAETGEITILSPDEVAGITAEVTISGCVLVYDGAKMDTGALTSKGLSPAEAIPFLIAQWQGGHIEASGYERLGEADAVSVLTGIDEGITQKTWFDIKTRLPLRAEIYSEGVMVVACVFNNVITE